MSADTSSESFAVPTLRGTVEILFRHRRKGILCFLVIVGCAIAYVVLCPRTFESKSKLFVRVGRENITLDPTATMGPTMMVQKSHDSEINSALEVLSSRGIAAKVVESIGAEKVLESDKKPGLMTQVRRSVVSGLRAALDALQPKSNGAGGGDGARNAAERATLRILKNVRVAAPKDSTVITIAARAGTPELAQEIAQTMTYVFLEEYARIHRTAGSFDFFRQQSESIAAQLTVAQQALRDRKNEYGLTSVDGRQRILDERLKDVDLAAMKTARAMAATRGKLRELADAVAAMPSEVEIQSEVGHPNDARNSMRARLFEIELQALEQRYTEDHPLAKALLAQRKQAASILSDESADRTQRVMGLNPVRVALETQMNSHQAELAALNAEVSVLKEQEKNIRDELLAFNGQRMEIMRLEQRATMLAEHYHTHLEKLEHARVDAELESQRISSINVSQPAMYVSKPLRPRKAIVLLAGIMMGVAGALGLIFTCEYCDTSLRNPWQVKAVLDLPVVLAIEHNGRQGRSLRRRALHR